MWTLQLKKGENILAEINNIPDNVSEETIFDLLGSYGQIDYMVTLMINQRVFCI